MKQTLHFSRATSSLLATVLSTVSFSVGLKYASDLSLPPQKAIFSSAASILCAIISIVAALYGAYRVFRPKTLISYDENGIFIPELDQIIPWSQVESIKAIKIAVGFSQSEASKKSAIDDGIAVNFRTKIQSKKRHGLYAHFSSENCFEFSCSLSDKGRDSILKEMNGLKASSTDKS